MVRTEGQVKRFLETQRLRNQYMLYEVEKIVDKWVINGRTYFEVKWAGYGTSENTLQSIRSLRYCKHLIVQFNNERRGRRRQATNFLSPREQ